MGERCSWWSWSPKFAGHNGISFRKIFRAEREKNIEVLSSKNSRSLVVKMGRRINFVTTRLVRKIVMEVSKTGNTDQTKLNIMGTLTSNRHAWCIYSKNTFQNGKSLKTFLMYLHVSVCRDLRLLLAFAISIRDKDWA